MRTSLTYKFVQIIPRNLLEGILYVSVEFKTAVHLCGCGCGCKVITPLTPNHWKLTFDGKSISLSPSIGNWNFACRSHYWIRNNEIVEAEKWDNEKVSSMRKSESKNYKSFKKKGN